MEPLLPAWSRALIAGALCGLVASVPLGPLGLTVINTALRRGFLVAFIIGLGGVCGEAVYVAVALAGHATFLGQPRIQFGLGLAAALVVAGVGVRHLLYRAESLERSAAVAERVEQRWHHPRAFVLGLALAATNVLLLVLWATLTAVLVAHNWLRPDRIGRASCLLGVMAGGTSWFGLLAFFVSRAHRRISTVTLTRLVRACGVVLLMLALLLAVKLVGGW
ncbi:LysE family transporter [bacterium]|nr:LysE family transporter [bacterium]